jgi:protein SCO1/2
MLPSPLPCPPAEKQHGAGTVVPVFVTLDPHRDSCEQVGAYVKDFHPSMVGLTGTPAQVASVAKAFRVYFADVDRQEDDDDYLGACLSPLVLPCCRCL